MTVKITEIEKTKHARLLRVEGKLTNGDAEMLERTLEELEGREKIAIDLSGVTFLDSDGASVLRQLERKGVELEGIDFFIEAIIAAHRD